MACPTVNLRAIVPSEDYEDMARRRYQRPNVQRTAAKRPRWYFRARVDVRTEHGVERREQPFYLGFCAEMGKREAERQRDAILAEAINRPQVLIQSQVKFAELLKAFRQDHLPTVREITRRNYEFVIGSAGVAGGTDRELSRRRAVKREQIASIKDAIEKAMIFVEAAAEPQVVYGFFHGGDPRDFSPDPEASTEAEHAAHKEACAAFDENKPLPGCCEHVFNEKGELSMIVTRAPFGLGTSTYRDTDAEDACAALKSALSALQAELMGETGAIQ